MVTKIRAVDDIFRRVTKSWPKNSDGFHESENVYEFSQNFLMNFDVYVRVFVISFLYTVLDRYFLPTLGK